MGETGEIGLDSEMNEMAQEYAEYAGKIEFCSCCGTAIGIKGEKFDDNVIEGEKWVQLPLWNRLELDQL